MLRFYIRLVLGIIFLIDAANRGTNVLVMLAYAALGIAMLYAASCAWRQEKDNS